MKREKLKHMIEVAREAGEEVLKIYKEDISWREKEDGSEVTNADEVAQEIILRELDSYGYGVLSEEKEDDLSRLEQERVWMIDPLDGTKNFIDRSGEFAIMIGLVERGEPVAGVVYVPISGKLYFAEKGGGSFMEQSNSQPVRLQVSRVPECGQAHYVMSRSHFSDEEKEIIERTTYKKVSHLGSVGLKMGLIAEGKGDAYINMSDKTHQWDIAAPELILREAGGKVTDTKGETFLYNRKETNNKHGIIASNGLIHQQIIDQIRTTT